MKIAGAPQVLTIEAVTDSWINNSIRPNPEYQRGSTWRQRQQQLLIDSVFRGYPLPRFYFQQKRSADPLGNPQVSLDVIDGQQRIIALSQYRQDNWPLFSIDDRRVALPESVRKQSSPWSGKTFSSLSETLQQRFLGFELPVVMIDEVSGDEVRDLFIRLQAGTPLTPQQVRDAWPGNVGPYIERLAGKGSRQGQFQTLFQAIDRRGQGGKSEDEYDDPALDSRQTCAQLLLLLLSLDKGRGYPSVASGALNDMYHENTELDSKRHTAACFEELLSDTQAVVLRRPDSMGRKAIRKNRLFSLFLFLRLLRFSPIDIKRALPQVSALFWRSSETDDSEPMGRVASASTLERHFIWFCDNRMSDLRAPELDPTRLFTESQKEEIWAAAAGICGVCGQPIDRSFAEFDHIEPWIVGGRTSVDNGRPVHIGCHARGLSAVEGRVTPLRTS